MKRIFQVAIFSAAIIFSSCSNNASNDATNKNTNDSDLIPKPVPPPMPRVMYSELNHVDANGKKQGKWIIYGKMSGDAAFNPTSKYEEGYYTDDLKDGEWTEYNPDETVKRTVNFYAGKEVK